MSHKCFYEASSGNTRSRRSGSQMGEILDANYWKNTDAGFPDYNPQTHWNER